MESTVSVSKGVFVFKNGIKSVARKSRKKSSQKQAYFCNNLWYVTYKELWNKVETKIEEINNYLFGSILKNLVTFLSNSYKAPVVDIPAAALLTGINMPDHHTQFQTLVNVLRQDVTSHVAVLEGDDCQNLKYLVEMLFSQLVLKEQDLEEEEEEEDDGPVLKKSQYSFSSLESWYKTQKQSIIVIIIPDFENFCSRVLQDFILISSSYLNVLPFVFVFGIATSLEKLHQSLPYQVSSKINIEVFHSSPSTVHLNNILERVFFSSTCPFHLGGKVFNLFTDIFLFYDLSVSGFIQNFKYAMLEHFVFGNVMSLCRKSNHQKLLKEFTSDDCANARRVLSFRTLVENEPPEIRIKLLTDDVYFLKVLKKEVRKIVNYLDYLHIFLKCLHVLVWDLPNAPLGKQVREIYAVTVSKSITSSAEYKTCLQLLSFQSRSELCEKLKKIEDLLSNNDAGQDEILSVIADQIRIYIDELENLDVAVEENVPTDAISGNMGRQELKTRLLQMSKTIKNDYTRLSAKILTFLHEQFQIYLMEPKLFYFHEIFFFDDISIKNQIVGTHRTAIHTGLNDPQYYLRCPCCPISNDLVILSSMPDISIIYKLHLECGKMINLYDWLQSYLYIVDPQELDEDCAPKVEPQFQARFTQAVAELEFLGFIKTSKRKTDHVARLTWGG